MTITKDEMETELKEAFSAMHLLFLAHDVRQLRPRDWKSFARSVDRLSHFIDEVEGKKAATDCICHERTPGESLMGRPCPVHRSSDKGLKNE